MNTTVQLEAPTASPAIKEQSISSTFLVETTLDLDDGKPTLSVSTDPTLGDLQVATADQVIAKAAEAHRAIDAGVRLALDFEAQQRTTPSVSREQAIEKVTAIVLGYAEKADDPIAFLDGWAKAYQAANHHTGSHYPWCQPGACFTGDPDEEGDYVDHRGAASSVSAPQFMRTSEGSLLRARLCSDASVGGGASVSLSGSNGNGAILAGDELDPVIGELATFLDELRVMRLHLKAAVA